MNTNEHDSDPRAALRQKLVAVLLGEAGPEEAAEVERALASDPELAAERERLEATIGLVAGLRGSEGSEHLSPAAASRLADAAAQRHPFRQAQGGPAAPRPWYASPIFRMAAMIAVLVGAFAAWRAGQPQQPAPELQASAERRVGTRGATGGDAGEGHG